MPSSVPDRSHTQPALAAPSGLPPADQGSLRGWRWRVGRWAPAMVAFGVITAAAVGLPTAADASVDLPDRTPVEVLAMVAGSQVQAFSGTLEQTSDLGLPSLPVGPGGTQGAPAVLELLTAPHTARVYMSPDAARLQVLDPVSERNVVWSSGSLWTYDAATNQATHMKLPDSDARQSDPNKRGWPSDRQTPATPAELAQQALAAITADTQVAVGRDGRVAGRTAYELILQPTGDTTLVGLITMAVDSETGMPLSFEVRARGADEPAFRMAFSSIDLQTPDPSLFEFTPPPGAQVKEIAAPADEPSSDGAPADKVEPLMVGTGWDAVAVFPAGTLGNQGFAGGSAPAQSPDPAQLELLSSLLTPVPEGLALRTSLISALVTNDGGLLVGSVPVERLQQVSGEQQSNQQ